MKKVELSLQKAQAEVVVDLAKVKQGKPIVSQLIDAIEKPGGAGHRFKAEEAPKPKDAPRKDSKKVDKQP